MIAALLSHKIWRGKKRDATTSKEEQRYIVCTHSNRNESFVFHTIRLSWKIKEKTKKKKEEKLRKKSHTDEVIYTY